MSKKIREKKRKKTYAVVAATVSTLAIVSAGTFAWQSISQSLSNENMLAMNPGGRLHDDFNGSNKDVYVENYTTKDENGSALYVRVRFSEYLELGTDAGLNKEEDDREVTPLVTGSKITDTSTWSIHKPETDKAEECDNGTEKSFHDYWTWELGGSTVYMPTFNKNKDSLEADINGTWSSIGENGKRYSDYETYTDGQKVTGTAQYSKDSLKGTPVKDESDENILHKEIADEEHTAKKTQNATVMTMEEWEEGGSVPGNYWVWDTDGWVYWAEALQPEEATGCLLTGIAQKTYISEEMYYAIDVVGEFATAFDWGTKGDGDNGTGEGATGFYANGMTDKGAALLERIASVVEDEDGNQYLSVGYNIYQQIYANGTYGDKFCAGADQIPGTADDSTVLIELESDLMIGTENYGTLFLGPVGKNRYMAVGKDGLLGTEDDVKIWYWGEGTFPGEQTDPNELTVQGVDEVLVTGITEGQEVEVGWVLSLTAVVKYDGNEIDNQDVTWTVEGGNRKSYVDAATKELKINADEKVGTELTVIARSNEDEENGVAKVKITVKESNSLFKNIEPGSTETVEIDGVAFYVLAKNGDETLLYAQNPIGESVFGSDKDQWNTESTIYKNLLIWLNRTTTLKDYAKETTIYTREGYNSENFMTSICKVFLLSEADVFGTFNNGGEAKEKDYTYNGQQLITNETIRKFSSNGYGSTAWLRSPYNLLDGVASRYDSSGALSTNIGGETFAMRAALWVKGL